MSCSRDDNDDAHLDVDAKSNLSDDLSLDEAMAINLKPETFNGGLNQYLLNSDETRLECSQSNNTSAALTSVHAALAALQAGQMSLNQVSQDEKLIFQLRLKWP